MTDVKVMSVTFLLNVLEIVIDSVMDPTFHVTVSHSWCGCARIAFVVEHSARLDVIHERPDEVVNVHFPVANLEVNSNCLGASGGEFMDGGHASVSTGLTVGQRRQIASRLGRRQGISWPSRQGGQDNETPPEV